MPAMHIVDSQGNNLEVAPLAAPAGSAGGRRPLVFLHEGLGSVAQWRDWPAQLCAATGRPAWLYSRHGYGRSSPVADVRGAGRLGPDYLHHQALQVLPQLLQHLGLTQPILVGHSDGASIALIHAAHHPVTACVVLAPHVMAQEVSLAAIAQARQAFEQGTLRERLKRFHDDVDSAFWQWNDVWQSPDFLGSFDIRAECQRISAPLLAIQGLDDEYASLAHLHELQRAAPHSRLLEVPACGHSPHRDQPEVVNAAIAAFLDSVA